MAKASKLAHRIIRRCLFYFCGLINQITPKINNRIFFSDTSVVRDNQYILLCYLIEKRYYEKYKIYFYSEDDNFIPPDFSTKIKVVKGKLSGLYYRFTSHYVFFAFGSNFMSCPSPKRQITVDLWHGFGLKKIEYEVKGSMHIIPLEKTFTKVIIPSPFFGGMIKKSLHCTDNQILIAGAPKNDELFLNINALSLINIDKSKYIKIVFYLPTYRNSARLGFSGYSSDLPLITENTIEDLNTSLTRMNILLIIKLHHTAQRDVILNITKRQLSNIKFLTNNDFNLKLNHFYEAMREADAIITDYSSVYQDFLLLDKPIGFVIDDYKEYENLRGFNFPDPLKIMPGPKIRTQEELIAFLRNLSEGKDAFIRERKKINNILNSYQGKSNCKELLIKLGINI